MSLIYVEMKRLKHYTGVILINIIMTVMFVLNAGQFFNHDLVAFLWVIFSFSHEVLGL